MQNGRNNDKKTEGPKSAGGGGGGGGGSDRVIWKKSDRGMGICLPGEYAHIPRAFFQKEWSWKPIAQINDMLVYLSFALCVLGISREIPGPGFF